MTEINIQQRTTKSEPVKKADEPCCLTSEHDKWSEETSWRLALLCCCCNTTGQATSMGEFMCACLPYMPIRCATGTRHFFCDSTWRIQNRLGICCNACGAFWGACCCCKGLPDHEFNAVSAHCSPLGPCDESTLKKYEKHGFRFLVNERSESISLPLIDDKTAAPPLQKM